MAVAAVCTPGKPGMGTGAKDSSTVNDASAGPVAKLIAAVAGTASPAAIWDTKLGSLTSIMTLTFSFIQPSSELFVDATIEDNFLRPRIMRCAMRWLMY